MNIEKYIILLGALGSGGGSALLPPATIAWTSDVTDPTPQVSITFPDVAPVGTVVHFQYADNAGFVSPVNIDDTITVANTGTLTLSPTMTPLTNVQWWLRASYTIGGINSSLSNVQTKTINAPPAIVTTHRGVSKIAYPDGPSVPGAPTQTFTLDLGTAACTVAVQITHEEQGATPDDIYPVTVVVDGVDIRANAVQTLKAGGAGGYSGTFWGALAAGSGSRTITVTWPSADGWPPYLSRTIHVWTLENLTSGTPAHTGYFKADGPGTTISQGAKTINVAAGDVLLVAGVSSATAAPDWHTASEAPDTNYPEALNGNGLVSNIASVFKIDFANASFTLGSSSDVQNVAATMAAFR